jgi:hypothetical protein
LFVSVGDFRNEYHIPEKLFGVSAPVKMFSAPWKIIMVKKIEKTKLVCSGNKICRNKGHEPKKDPEFESR